MKKILVIEDEPEVRENIAEILQLSGYEVMKACDCPSGVVMAGSELPDLILCDIALPGMDGYEVLHLLHSSPLTVAIPFIFLTAATEKEDIRKGMAAGADDYLTKPFEGIDLLRAVEACLKKRKPQPGPDSSKLTQPVEMGKPSVISLLRLDPAERDVTTFRKKQRVYSEGQRPAFIYYVVSGKVKTFRIHPDGKEFITHLAGAGDFLGHVALLQDGNYRDSAQALEEASLMLVPRQEFLAAMGADRRIAQYFIDLLGRDIKAQEDSLMSLAYHSLRKRVANGLLQLMVKFREGDGDSPVTGISRDNLSHFIGSATESLTRTLSDFRNEQLIDIREGKIYLLNRERLSKLVN